MNALSQDVIVQDMYKELHKKLKITLQPIVPFEMPVVWYEDLLNCIKNERPYIKLCWLKTACGAWCTASRLSTYKNRPCIFGCEGERDEMCHYLQCPILWQLASEALCQSDSSICILNKIGLLDPSSAKLKRLAFCHALYHSCVNDPHCIKENGMPFPSLIVQARASELFNHCIHFSGVT